VTEFVFRMSSTVCSMKFTMNYNIFEEDRLEIERIMGGHNIAQCSHPLRSASDKRCRVYSVDDFRSFLGPGSQLFGMELRYLYDTRAKVARSEFAKVVRVVEFFRSER